MTLSPSILNVINVIIWVVCILLGIGIGSLVGGLVGRLFGWMIAMWSDPSAVDGGTAGWDRRAAAGRRAVTLNAWLVAYDRLANPRPRPRGRSG